jgi:FlaA1/EpsC-like NDP-sugar epimerase
MNFIIHYFTNRYLSRWMVLIFDLATIPVAYFLAYLLRYNFDLNAAMASMNMSHFAAIIPVYLLVFWRLRPYSGILRHSNTRDVGRILMAMLLAALMLIFLVELSRAWEIVLFASLPLSVIIIMNLVTSAVLIWSRLMARTILNQIRRSKGTNKVMIYGTGHLGHLTLEALQMDTSSETEVVGFIDEDPALDSRHLCELPIFTVDHAFDSIIPEKNVTEIILAVEPQKMSLKQKKKFTEQCISRRIVVKELPPIESWINRKLEVKSIRKINILDLLGREAIQLDHEKIKSGLRNSVVLVAGAAGSIGSEIIRQMIAFNAKQVILLDKAESDLFNLQEEILARNSGTDFRVVIADITNKERIRNIFTEYRPDMVINAAAYKHVPLMEDCPCEAIRVNVGGTMNLADLSVEFGVGKFVFISTDKVVNPTNVMGASKRISEIYIQSMMQSGKFATRFITTRFGNVLGSCGSVVPLFEKQIQRGGPVTVTHKDITRYFMTIPEACQLVLEAGFMGNGGEIFVFDMGEPVRIHDLAEKMISLSGYVPNVDIDIKITGLRPGEKLYEELLDNKEELLPTYNDKIFIGKVRKHDYLQVSGEIGELLTNIDGKKCLDLVRKMMEIVPEFSPTNANYSPFVSRNGATLRMPEPQVNKRKCNGEESLTFAMKSRIAGTL